MTGVPRTPRRLPFHTIENPELLTPPNTRHTGLSRKRKAIAVSAAVHGDTNGNDDAVDNANLTSRIVSPTKKNKKETAEPLESPSPSHNARGGYDRRGGRGGKATTAGPGTASRQKNAGSDFTATGKRRMVPTFSTRGNYSKRGGRRVTGTTSSLRLSKVQEQNEGEHANPESGGEGLENENSTTLEDDSRDETYRQGSTESDDEDEEEAEDDEDGLIDGSGAGHTSYDRDDYAAYETLVPSVERDGPIGTSYRSTESKYPKNKSVATPPRSSKHSQPLVQATPTHPSPSGANHKTADVLRILGPPKPVRDIGRAFSEARQREERRESAISTLSGQGTRRNEDASPTTGAQQSEERSQVGEEDMLDRRGSVGAAMRHSSSSQTPKARPKHSHAPSQKSSESASIRISVEGLLQRVENSVSAALRKHNTSKSHSYQSRSEPEDSNALLAGIQELTTSLPFARREDIATMEVSLSHHITESLRRMVVPVTRDDLDMQHTRTRTQLRESFDAALHKALSTLPTAAVQDRKNEELKTWFRETVQNSFNDFEEYLHDDLENLPTADDLELAINAVNEHVDGQHDRQEHARRQDLRTLRGALLTGIDNQIQDLRNHFDEGMQVQTETQRTQFNEHLQDQTVAQRAHFDQSLQTRFEAQRHHFEENLHGQLNTQRNHFHGDLQERFEAQREHLNQDLQNHLEAQNTHFNGRLQEFARMLGTDFGQHLQGLLEGQDIPALRASFVDLQAAIDALRTDAHNVQCPVQVLDNSVELRDRLRDLSTQIEGLRTVYIDGNRTQDDWRRDMDSWRANFSNYSTRHLATAGSIARLQTFVQDQVAKITDVGAIAKFARHELRDRLSALETRLMEVYLHTSTIGPIAEAFPRFEELATSTHARTVEVIDRVNHVERTVQGGHIQALDLNREAKANVQQIRSDIQQTRNDAGWRDHFHGLELGKLRQSLQAQASETNAVQQAAVNGFHEQRGRFDRLDTNVMTLEKRTRELQEKGDATLFEGLGKEPEGVKKQLEMQLEDQACRGIASRPAITDTNLLHTPSVQKHEHSHKHQHAHQQSNHQVPLLTRQSRRASPERMPTYLETAKIASHQDFMNNLTERLNSLCIQDPHSIVDQIKALYSLLERAEANILIAISKCQSKVSAPRTDEAVDPPRNGGEPENPTSGKSSSESTSSSPISQVIYPSTVDPYRAKIDTLEALIAEMKHQFEVLDLTYTTLVNDSSEQADELARARDHSASLQSEISHLKDTRSAMAAQLVAAGDVIDESACVLAGAEADLETLSRRRADLDQYVKDLLEVVGKNDEKGASDVKDAFAEFTAQLSDASRGHGEDGDENVELGSDEMEDIIGGPTRDV